MDNDKHTYTIYCLATVNFTADIVAESYEEASRIAEYNVEEYIRNDNNMQAYYVQTRDVTDEL